MASQADSTLVLTRTFDAPRELVFAAWVEPEQLARWFGPRNIAATVDRMDAHQDGSYRITLRAADSGEIYAVRGSYREVVPPERLVFTWAWEEDCPTHEKDVESVVTVVFRERGAKTEIVLQHAQLAPKMRTSTPRGWNASLDRLAEHLAAVERGGK
jgi:uncharacterized protein YndB with AHSA1/START domain